MRNKLVFLVASIMMPMGAAFAVDHPPIKEGFWKIHTQTVDSPGNKKNEGTIMLCRDHAFDQSVEALSKSRKGCTTLNESYADGKYSVEARCEIGSTVIDSKSNATFQGDTSAHAETHVTFTPAFYGNTDETMIQDQTYLGSCPDGMHPGDRKTQDGTIRHLQR